MPSGTLVGGTAQQTLQTNTAVANAAKRYPQPNGAFNTPVPPGSMLLYQQQQQQQQQQMQLAFQQQQHQQLQHQHQHQQFLSQQMQQQGGGGGQGQLQAASSTIGHNAGVDGLSAGLGSGSFSGGEKESPMDESST